VLVIALAVVVLGLANLEGQVGFDYVFGTWHVALGVLCLIAAGLIVAAWLLATLAVGLRDAGRRRALEGELERAFTRLRQAEALGGADGAAAVTVDSAADTEAATGALPTPPEGDDGPSVGA
jgi:uncharacterized integral membrane protein